MCAREAVLCANGECVDNVAVGVVVCAKLLEEIEAFFASFEDELISIK